MGLITSYIFITWMTAISYWRTHCVLGVIKKIFDRSNFVGQEQRKESLPYLVKHGIRFNPVLVFLILKYQTGQSPDTLIYMLDKFITLINRGINTSVRFNTQRQTVSVDSITKSFDFCFLIAIVSFSNLVGHKQLSPKQQSHCFPRSLK